MAWCSHGNPLGWRVINAIPTLAAVLVAAGRGNRMSQGTSQAKSQGKNPTAAVPGAYLPLAGKPVIAHSLLSLAALNGMGTLVVVYHPDDHDLASPLQALRMRACGWCRGRCAPIRWRRV
jgi:2-C-methyl-D-erythritol 4-phosphate cytidylyltransferase